MHLRKEKRIGGLLGWIASTYLVVILGCSSGEIQNFAGIKLDSDSRLERLDIRVFLVDRNGNNLLWNSSILTPQIGVSTVSESEFTTNAKIYSMRQGARGIKVYDGQLFDLRWSREVGSPFRLLRAEVPHALINEDPERDTEIGSMTITVQTDKQGPFTATLEKTQVYSSSLN